MSPKIVDREKRREKIVTSSLDLFVRKGFRGTSIRELAANTGESMGTLYHYFESKEDLFEQTLRHFFSTDRMMLSSMLQDDLDASERLDRLAIFMSSHLPEYQKIITLFMDFIVSTEDRQKVQRICTEILHDYVELLSQVFRDGIDQGWLRNVSPEDLSNIVIVFFDGLVMHSFAREGFDFDRVARIFLDILQHGVLRTPVGTRSQCDLASSRKETS